MYFCIDLNIVVPGTNIGFIDTAVKLCIYKWIIIIYIRYIYTLHFFECYSIRSDLQFQGPCRSK